MIVQKVALIKKLTSAQNEMFYTICIYKYTVWQLIWKLIFLVYTENWKSVSVWLRYIPKPENPYRYFSVYTETSKSIPIFFWYIPKHQNPYRYFSVYTETSKIHTDIFRYHTIPKNTDNFSVSVWYRYILINIETWIFY